MNVIIASKPKWGNPQWFNDLALICPSLAMAGAVGIQTVTSHGELRKALSCEKQGKAVVVFLGWKWFQTVCELERNHPQLTVLVLEKEDMCTNWWRFGRDREGGKNRLVNDIISVCLARC